MLIEGDQRRKFGEMLAASALRRVPGLSEGDLQRERDKALRAPLIIVVACRIVPGTKVPAIEQLLAAGAAAQNILLALHALGYVAAWKTGEAAYDTEVKKALGFAADDHSSASSTPAVEPARRSPRAKPPRQDAMLDRSLLRANDQQLRAFAHLVAHLAQHALDLARGRRGDRLLHLHGFEHHERRALGDLVARLHVHGQHAARHRGPQAAVRIGMFRSR